MKAALDEQGFTAKNFKENRLVAWEESERAAMESILNSHGMSREDRWNIVYCVIYNIQRIKIASSVKCVIYVSKLIRRNTIY